VAPTVQARLVWERLVWERAPRPFEPSTARQRIRLLADNSSVIISLPTSFAALGRSPKPASRTPRPKVGTRI
jgi:hypothetical protein